MATADGDAFFDEIDGVDVLDKCGNLEGVEVRLAWVMNGLECTWGGVR